MFIRQIECPNCRKQGRLDSEFFFNRTGREYNAKCRICNTLFPLEDHWVQRVLSAHPSSRLSALSNHSEFGEISIKPGEIARIDFKTPFDVVTRATFCPQGSRSKIVRDEHLSKESMSVIAADSDLTKGGDIRAFWKVEGLINVDQKPAWYLQLYSAATHVVHGLYRPAVIDYALAFELILEETIRRHLYIKCGEECSSYIMDKNWRVEDRCKQVLELATGHRMTDHPGMYNSWDKHVRKLRNSIAHGKCQPLDEKQVQKTHEAAFQAIWWLECLEPKRTISGEGEGGN